MAKGEKTFGRHIKAARALYGLTQEDLAKGFGVDKALISHWERGKRTMSHQHFVKMCAVFGWTGKEKARMERLKLAGEAGE